MDNSKLKGNKPVKDWNSKLEKTKKSLVNATDNVVPNLKQIGGGIGKGATVVGGGIGKGAKGIGKGAVVVGGGIGKGAVVVGGGIGKGAVAVGGAIKTGAGKVGGVFSKIPVKSWGSKLIGKGRKKSVDNDATYKNDSFVDHLKEGNEAEFR